jgi:hypothetical protein
MDVTGNWLGGMCGVDSAGSGYGPVAGFLITVVSFPFCRHVFTTLDFPVILDGKISSYLTKHVDLRFNLY